MQNLRFEIHPSEEEEPREKKKFEIQRFKIHPVKKFKEIYQAEEEKAEGKKKFEIELKPGEDVFEHIQEEISTSVVEDLEKEDQQEIEKLENKKEISKAAGEYFMSLIPQSKRKPEKEYSQEDAHLDVEEINSLFQGHDVAVSKGKNKSSINFIGEIYQSETESGTKQYNGYAFSKSGDYNIIKEEVYNLLHRTHNDCIARLTVISPDDKIKLNLQELLPKGARFRPAEMLKTKEEANYNSTRTPRTIPISIDLEEYKGTKYAKGSFAFRHIRDISSKQTLGKEVLYGNLTEKGRMLALLHEIAHSWQFAYYDYAAASEFEKLYVQMNHNLYTLYETKKTDEEIFEMLHQNIQKAWEPVGIKIDKDKFVDDGRKLEQDEFRIKIPSINKSFIVKGEIFAVMLEKYEQSERSAWAHAVKVLRFLRKQGIDLEPDLKTLADFEDVVDKALASYQNSLEEMIESSTRGVQFAKKPK